MFLHLIRTNSSVFSFLSDVIVICSFDKISLFDRSLPQNILWTIMIVIYNNNPLITA